tara:strand:+ start:103 stop:333 length:231 start_codon:yes stop_codon:yes gene_type:complete
MKQLNIKTMKMKRMDEGSFLHDKKRKKKTILEDKYNGSVSEYNRDRRRKKIKAKKDREGKGFVTKDIWELMFELKL